MCHLQTASRVDLFWFMFQIVWVVVTTFIEPRCVLWRFIASMHIEGHQGRERDRNPASAPENGISHKRGISDPFPAHAEMVHEPVNVLVVEGLEVRVGSPPTTWLPSLQVPLSAKLDST